MRWALGAMLFCLCTQVMATSEQQAMRVVGDAIVAPLSDVTGSAEEGEQIFAARDAGHCVLCHQVSGISFAANLPDVHLSLFRHLLYPELPNPNVAQFTAATSADNPDGGT